MLKFLFHISGHLDRFNVVSMCWAHGSFSLHIIVRALRRIMRALRHLLVAGALTYYECYEHCRFTERNGNKLQLSTGGTCAVGGRACTTCTSSCTTPGSQDHKQT